QQRRRASRRRESRSSGLVLFPRSSNLTPHWQFGSVCRRLILGDIQLHAQHSVVRNCSPKASWTVMEVGRLPAPECFGTFFGSELIEATATSSIECGLLAGSKADAAGGSA